MTWLNQTKFLSRFSCGSWSFRSISMSKARSRSLRIPRGDLNCHACRDLELAFCQDEGAHKDEALGSAPFQSPRKSGERALPLRPWNQSCQMMQGDSCNLLRLLHLHVTHCELHVMHPLQFEEGRVGRKGAVLNIMKRNFHQSGLLLL